MTAVVALPASLDPLALLTYELNATVMAEHRNFATVTTTLSLPFALGHLLAAAWPILAIGAVALRLIAGGEVLAAMRAGSSVVRLSRL